jgi:hypothetical protein
VSAHLGSGWFAFAMPAPHDRTRWWGAVTLFVPIVGFWIYALTLDDRSTAGEAGVAHA